MIIDLSMQVISGNNFFQSIFCQKKHAVRKERNSEETWQLSRFYPLIEVNFIMLEHIKFIFLYFYGLSWLFSLVSSLFFPCLLPYMICWLKENETGYLFIFLLMRCFTQGLWYHLKWYKDGWDLPVLTWITTCITIHFGWLVQLREKNKITKTVIKQRWVSSNSVLKKEKPKLATRASECEPTSCSAAAAAS